MRQNTGLFSQPPVSQLHQEQQNLKVRQIHNIKALSTMNATLMRGHGYGWQQQINKRPMTKGTKWVHRGQIMVRSGSKYVIGMGSCGLDYLARVDKYPEPDAKIRTTDLQFQGGGNIANALTGVARMGLKPKLVSKIGDDGAGSQIMKELQNDGVDTQHVIVASGKPSPFTYIIVDSEGGTRTCIHTPGDPLRDDELPDQRIDDILQDACIVVFDGRLALQAVRLAKAARTRGIPVVVEAEKVREDLESLLLEADVIFTSKHYPQDYFSESSSLGDSITRLLDQNPTCHTLVTTLGTKGSIAVTRSGSATQDSPTKTSPQELNQLGQELDQAINSVLEMAQKKQQEHESNVEIVTSNGTNISQCGVEQCQVSFKGELGDVELQIHGACIAGVPEGAAFDTTGAGDAFMSALVLSKVKGLQTGSMLRLGSAVSASNCTQLGARGGMPTSKQFQGNIRELLK